MRKSAPETAPPTCAECHQAFPAEAMVPLGDLWACAQCKPRLLQRLAEGSALPLPKHCLMQDGDCLVVQQGTRLPPRCIRCNLPAPSYIFRRRFILVDGIPRRVVLDLPICASHQTQRHWHLGLSGMGMVLSLTLAMSDLPLFQRGNTGVFVLIWCLFACAAWFVVWLLMIEAVKNRDGFVWLKGFNTDYLKDLPHWPQSADRGRKRRFR